jgi:hypothetical protein
MNLLAIDPGASTGWAYFENCQIVSCGAVRGKTYIPLVHPDLVLIENPVIYPRSKARPADILKVARIVGWYEHQFSLCKVQLVEPREWKGTIPKEIMLRRIFAHLTSQEKVKVKGMPHDTLDAIGLGLWKIGPRA